MKDRLWKKGLDIMNKGKSGRWKGAGLGMYYCSLCLCERGNLELTSECPECHAQLDIPKRCFITSRIGKCIRIK